MSVEDARWTSMLMMLGGFLFLPWLWLMNALYFRRHLKHGGDPRVRRYVIVSLAFGCMEMVLLITWYGLFVTRWYTWGVIGEKIALTLSWGPQ